MSEEGDFIDDNTEALLASLTAAELEELSQEVLDMDGDGWVPAGLRQRNQTDKQPSLRYNRMAMLDFCEQQTKRLIQREMSTEGETSGDGGERRGSHDVNTEQEDKPKPPDNHTCSPTADHSSSGSGNAAGGTSDTSPRDDVRLFNTRPSDTSPSKVDANEDTRGRKAELRANKQQQDREVVATGDEGKKDFGKDAGEEADKNSEGLCRAEVKGETKRGKKEERRGNNKTLDLISKLQRRNEARREERAGSEEDGRKRTECSKTKDLVSKLQHQTKRDKRREADGGGKTPKTKGPPTGAETVVVDEKERVQALLAEKEPSGLQHSIRSLHSSSPTQNTTVRSEGNARDSNDVQMRSRRSEEEKSVAAGNGTEQSLDVSMFEDLLERVRGNDPSLTEVNLNNSEAVRVQTLVQFAEALRLNASVRTLALANTRADDRVAHAVARTLQEGHPSLTSVNLDSNLLTSRGILALIRAIQNNTGVTELRFHNQRHICGGKAEMEMAELLRDNTSLLKLGFHFELAGPRMAVAGLLSRNVDLQRQRRLAHKLQAEEEGRPTAPASAPVPHLPASTAASKVASKVASTAASTAASKVASTVVSNRLAPEPPQDKKKRNMFSHFMEKKTKTPAARDASSHGPAAHSIAAKHSGPQVVTPTAPGPASTVPGRPSLRKPSTPSSPSKQEGHGSRGRLLDSICSGTLKVLKKVDVPKRLR